MNGQSSAQYSSLRHKNEKYTQNDSKKLLRPPSPAFSKWHLVRVCGSVLGEKCENRKIRRGTEAVRAVLPRVNHFPAVICLMALPCFILFHMLRCHKCGTACAGKMRIRSVGRYEVKWVCHAVRSKPDAVPSHSTVFSSETKNYTHTFIKVKSDWLSIQ